MLHSSNVQGCPADIVHSDPNVDNMDLFKFGVARRRVPVDPSFLVPAVVDCLRESPRYRHISHVVPGEADVFCANHLLRNEGVVITSDSDLLAHKLGSGRVVFFRDIHEDKGSLKLKSLSYSPSKIFLALGLKHASDGTRLAFELKLYPQATLAQVVKKCRPPITNSDSYFEFCRQYLPPDDPRSEVATNSIALTLDRLDPRVSELLLELNSTQGGRLEEVCVNMFLPLLVDSPKRASAWEQSFSIRQLAYSIANFAHQNDKLCVREFRQIQSQSQMGRQVSLLSEKHMQDSTDHILACVHIVNQVCNPLDERYWIYFSIAFGLVEYYRHEMHTLIQEAVGQNWDRALPKTPGKFDWDLVHIIAQLHGCLYSLRILEQVLSALRDTELESGLEQFLPLHNLLLRPLPLNRYPQIDEICEIFDAVRRQQLIELVQGIHRDSSQEERLVQDSSRSDSDLASADVLRHKKRANCAHPRTSKKPVETNVFHLLSSE